MHLGTDAKGSDPKLSGLAASASELFADMAAELLIGIDGDEGLLRGLSDVEFPSPAYLGDFIEAEAEVVHWGDGPGHYEFVLGTKGGMGARTEVVRLLAEMIPRGSTWSAAGVGRHQLRMAELAVRRGGHARVGLEDNVNLSRGVQAQGSAPLVAKVAEYAKSIGRPIADVATARKLLGIQK